MCTQLQLQATNWSKHVSQNSTFHGAVGNHIFVEYYTTSAPFMFISFLVVNFVIQGDINIELVPGNNTLIGTHHCLLCSTDTLIKRDKLENGSCKFSTSNIYKELPL